MEVFHYKCYYSDCQRSYKTKYNLKRHINSNHLLIKDFSCEFCAKTFASKQNLQGHESLHKEFLLIPKFEVPDRSMKDISLKCTEINIFNLSRLYHDPVIVYGLITSVSKQTMPILPPISGERSAEGQKSKLPIIPILL